LGEISKGCKAIKGQTCPIFSAGAEGFEQKGSKVAKAKEVALSQGSRRSLGYR